MNNQDYNPNIDDYYEKLIYYLSEMVALRSNPYNKKRVNELLYILHCFIEEISDKN